jgi:hypothetical protein
MNTAVRHRMDVWFIICIWWCIWFLFFIHSINCHTQYQLYSIKCIRFGIIFHILYSTRRVLCTGGDLCSNDISYRSVHIATIYVYIHRLCLYAPCIIFTVCNAWLRCFWLQCGYSSNAWLFTFALQIFAVTLYISVDKVSVNLRYV